MNLKISRDFGIKFILDKLNNKKYDFVPFLIEKILGGGKVFISVDGKDNDQLKDIFNRIYDKKY